VTESFRDLCPECRPSTRSGTALRPPRAIHAHSPQREGPFIGVNAGAIPPTLLESTLFGSKRGAFTDSRTDQQGLFEAARDGTFFLDEIAETSADVQIRLLRVLQEKVIMRVGDTATIPVNVRVIAATNRELKSEVDAGRFRADLYFRLAVVPITVPPLRERAEDIRILAEHFLEKHAAALGKPMTGIAPRSLEKLGAYSWPGNVRELDNVIQRAVILAEDSLIQPELLLLDHPPKGLDEALDRPFREATLAFERLYFRRLLDRTSGNKSKAAERLGIERKTLYRKLERMKP